MDIRFDTRTVLVTGGAQGIGRAIGNAFHEAGARVHLADIDEAGVRRSAEEVDAVAHVVDLSDQKAAARLIATVIETEGRLDILALAAGGVRGQVGRPIEEITEQDWHALFRANVDGAFYLIQAATPHLKSAGWGRIVTISSAAGLRPSLTGIHGYTAAKHALIGLTKQMSSELARYGVTVNSIAPGLIPSNPETVKQWERYGAEGQQRILATLHTGRLGAAEDIAHAALFLASAQAGWITGQVLSVDGGRV
jgi:3-oxoacyl-[acyl-carrier protein] reductase